MGITKQNSSIISGVFQNLFSLLVSNFKSSLKYRHSSSYQSVPLISLVCGICNCFTIFPLLSKSERGYPVVLTKRISAYLLSCTGVTYKTGFGLNDWIHCLIHTTRNYKQLQRYR
jgi:hypothetical protein